MRENDASHVPMREVGNTHSVPHFVFFFSLFSLEICLVLCIMVTPCSLSREHAEPTSLPSFMLNYFPITVPISTTDVPKCFCS